MRSMAILRWMSEGQTPERREGIRRIIASIVGEDASTTANEDERSSLIDTATRALSGRLERWGQGSALRRLFGGVERDVLTGPGEWVELEAQLGVAAKLGSVARFTIDRQPVAELPIGDRGELRAMVRAPGPGLYELGVELELHPAVQVDRLAVRLLEGAHGGGRWAAELPRPLVPGCRRIVSGGAAEVLLERHPRREVAQLAPLRGGVVAEGVAARRALRPGGKLAGVVFTTPGANPFSKRPTNSRHTPKPIYRCIQDRRRTAETINQRSKKIRTNATHHCETKQV